ncbi:MAG TPA: YciI family protein [Candidatus Limnocylindria bacterium]|jgi:hypothetical protein
MSQYMLMFVGNDEWFEAQSKEALDKAMGGIMAWWDDLEKKGVIKSGEQLARQRTATSVKRVKGQMKVSDGPFIESKESVGGYALIEVEDLDKAIAIAKSWPGGDVEVRPVVEH